MYVLQYYFYAGSEPHPFLRSIARQGTAQLRFSENPGMHTVQNYVYSSGHFDASKIACLKSSPD